MYKFLQTFKMHYLERNTFLFLYAFSFPSLSFMTLQNLNSYLYEHYMPLHCNGRNIVLKSKLFFKPKQIFFHSEIPSRERLTLFFKRLQISLFTLPTSVCSVPAMLESQSSPFYHEYKLPTPQKHSS